MNVIYRTMFIILGSHVHARWKSDFLNFIHAIQNIQARAVVPEHDEAADSIDTNNRAFRANRWSLQVIHFYKADTRPIGGIRCEASQQFL